MFYKVFLVLFLSLPYAIIAMEQPAEGVQNSYSIEKAYLRKIVHNCREYGESPNFIDPSTGYAPLHMAISFGDFGSVKDLIALGADIHMASESGKAPLLIAARCGKADIMKYLLEKGADPNARDNQGDAPLTLATQGGFVTAVELLINFNADLKYVNTRKCDPHVAAIIRAEKEARAANKRKVCSII